MKIIYIHQYFKTPEEGGAIRSYYLAKGLVDAGHEVELITTHHHSTAITKVIEGITVHYFPIAYQNRWGFLKRVFVFLAFAKAAYFKAASITNADFCYITSTPLTVGLTALALKKLNKLPYIFEVRDLWPEAPIQMGVLNNYFLRRAFQILEAKTYEHASGIVALSPGILSGIEKVISNKNTLMLPNISDCSFFNITRKQSPQGKFVLTYMGAIGVVNHLESLIEIAKYCKTALPQLEIRIAGEGGRVESLRDAIAKFQLDNVIYLGFVNKTGIKALLEQSDAVYISFASLPILETNSPNKFFDSLAAGKLTVVNTKGWIKELIEEAGCGVYVNPQKPEEFVSKILPFIQSPDLLLQAQQKARLLAETQFSRELQTNKLDSFVKNVYKK